LTGEKEAGKLKVPKLRNGFAGNGKSVTDERARALKASLREPMLNERRHRYFRLKEALDRVGGSE
jgi:hypothetical protein